MTVLIILLMGTSGLAQAQEVRLDRLSPDLLDVLSPAARVQGVPGSMRIVERSCRTTPAADLRQRIVNVATQEWAYFGFTVLDQTNEPEARTRRPDGPWRPRTWLGPEESARLASSIAGYWAVTPDGPWILDRQNEVWKGANGIGARWRDPWSAAFVSWVMCEAGLSDASLFRRAIAHHTYIDQAIIARDSTDSRAAFRAFEVGEQPIKAGDLLCLARRPGYTSVAERRAQLGTGIRSHCDIVVKVDVPGDRILVIGGNVRGSVRLKLHAANFVDDAGKVSSVGRGRRTVFAHLRLETEAAKPDVFESSPTMRALASRPDDLAIVQDRLQDESAASQTISQQSYGRLSQALEGAQ